MTETARLRWGIIATGAIARTFAKALPQSRTGRLVAVGSRTQAGADAFAADFPCRAHGSYAALLADPEVEAVYISTPHPQHAEWAVAAARAGKHILCEKPIALNHAEAMLIAEAARRHGVFLMEAFMYRCHPQTTRIVEIVRSGRLGEVRLVNAAFGWDVGSFKPESRLFNHALGGGSILDVGCYCASMARLVAGAAADRPYLDPVEVKAVGHLAESGVDDYTQALLTFSGGMQAHLVTATRAKVGASVTIVGSRGTLRVPSPWICDVQQKMELEADGKVDAIEVPDEGGLYTFEIDAVAEHRDWGESPFMPVDDTLGNMATLDRWRAEIGLTYDMEKPRSPDVAVRLNPEPQDR